MLELSPSTIFLDCIALAALLVYAPFLVVAYGRVKVGYDLGAPRALFEKLPNYAKRASWAHQNSFETFILFATASIMAYLTEQDSVLAIIAALTFVVGRFFYSIFYIFDVPIGRSLMFAISSSCTAILFILSLSSVNNF
ncbi:MAPEG family protein [Okeania sp.]|uniref:MAPEG family protein n=1 Tax=Okeania sp. TaxID=3100323 RepID=UPI002B4ACC85|nr:MAPEG family protein [Okeania sp.]MEB3341299.1 MAPEG family protein [Okeania sp.]